MTVLNNWMFSDLTYTLYFFWIFELIINSNSLISRSGNHARQHGSLWSLPGNKFDLEVGERSKSTHGTNQKGLSQGSCMPNINGLSLILQKIWVRLKFLWQTDGQMSVVAVTLPIYCKTLIIRVTLFSRNHRSIFIHETLFSRLVISSSIILTLLIIGEDFIFASLFSREFTRK